MRMMMILGALLIVVLIVMSFPQRKTAENDEERVFLHDSREFKKQQIDFLLPKFVEEGIAGVQVSKGKISVPRQHRQKCNEIIRNADFSKLTDTTGNQPGAFARTFLSPSEKERIALEKKLATLKSILGRLSGIRDSIIVYDQVKASTFKRKLIHSAVVTLWAKEGHVIEQLHAATARRIVKSAFAGMEESEVLVVDGDTGMTFSSVDESTSDRLMVKNQLDLEATRQEFAKQCKKLISEYGAAEVKVKMTLEERRNPLPPKPQINVELHADSQHEEDEVVANGNGQIGTVSQKKVQTPAQPEFENVLIKRLLGIQVSIEKSAIEDYLRKHLGLRNEISDDQFSRGVVSVRNEITKKIVSWIRSEGIDVDSDIVAVSVLPAEPIEELSAETPTVSTARNTTYLVGLGLALVVSSVLITAGFKSRSPQNRVNNPNQFSNAGRDFVNRSQTNPGALLADEVNDVVQSEPEKSAQAFQDFVTGETTP